MGYAIQSSEHNVRVLERLSHLHIHFTPGQVKSVQWLFNCSIFLIFQDPLKSRKFINTFSFFQVKTEIIGA